MKSILLSLGFGLGLIICFGQYNEAKVTLMCLSFGRPSLRHLWTPVNKPRLTCYRTRDHVEESCLTWGHPRPAGPQLTCPLTADTWRSQAKTRPGPGEPPSDSALRAKINIYHCISKSFVVVVVVQYYCGNSYGGVSLNHDYWPLKSNCFLSWAADACWPLVYAELYVVIFSSISFPISCL